MSLLATPKKYMNLKNGNTYIMTGTSRNCTNAQDGQLMASYHQEGFPNFPLTREINEFHVKFKELP